MMMRPKSAKTGQRPSEPEEDLSDGDSRDQFGGREPIKTETQKNKNRMQSASHQRRFMNIAKPVDVATGEFTRIMPKHIYHDKEKLYSEALQLRQQMNATADENIKLKTKVAVLEREKEKLSRMADHDNRLYSSGAGGAPDQGLITKLKKMLRDAQEEVRVLQSEGKKLKKTVKYTKISELEVENKSLIDESIRLNRIVEELMDKHDQDMNQQNRLEQLQSFLNTKMAENEQLVNTNKRLADEVQNLQQNAKSNQSRTVERQKKLNKDLDIAKRRLADSKRQTEYLVAQLNKLREEKQKQPQPQPTTNPLRGRLAPASENTRSNPSLNDMEALKKRNQQLEAKLSQLMKQQQQAAKNGVKEAPQQSPVKQSEKKQQPDVVSQAKRPSKPEAVEEPVEKKLPSEQPQADESGSQSKSHLAFSISEQPQQKPLQLPQKSGNAILEQKQKNDSYYGQQFEQEEKPQREKSTPSQHKKSPSKKPTEQESVKYEEYKEDFADQDDRNQEEILYKKQEKKADGSSKKKKAEKSSKASKTPHKKELTEISELLTYRMKAQRYPFNELEQDIVESGEAEFQVGELSSMLQNSPFFLTDQHVSRTLQYLFDNPERFDEKAKLKVEKLVEKLRKLIKPFDLLEEEEEDGMDMRIAEMVTTYASELQAAFEQKRNGPDTISKADLEDLFRQLELQTAYIELIVGRLSLVSDDLQHLNYYQFFREYYEGDEMQVQQVDEQYDPSNSRTLQRGGMIQEQQMQESEESKRSKRREDKKKGRRAAYDIQ